MRTLRFHEYGPALDVLHLEDAPSPVPGPGQICVAVGACGLTPADWALCTGLFRGQLPRGIGLEVAGTVDAIGEGVSDVAVGDAVFGPAPFTGASAGASEQAVLDVWFARPDGLDAVAAAALPMAVETAQRGLDVLGVQAGQTVLVNGAGTTVGYAAVQIAIRLGATVIATAGSTYAEALRSAGAVVTTYGDGLAERVAAITGGTVDLVLDTAPADNALPGLVSLVARPSDVLTLSDWAAAGPLGVQFGGNGAPRTDVLGAYGRLTAEGRFSVPVARTFALDHWRAAAELSLSSHAHGKVVLLIG